MILSVDRKGADLKQTDGVEKRQTASEATMFCPGNDVSGLLGPKHFAGLPLGHLALFEITVYQFYPNSLRHWKISKTNQTELSI